MEPLSKPLRFDSVQDYPAWTRAKTDPGRTEMDDGAVVRMASQTVEHLRTKARVQAALSRAIAAARAPCEALPDGANRHDFATHRL